MTRTNLKGQRPELKCEIYPKNTFSDYKYVVVCSFSGNRYLLSRHKLRDTFETQGGHIEAGESCLDAAKRELFEESGVSNATLHYVFDYNGYTDYGNAHGAVFAALIHSVGALPKSEMAEIKLFDSLPENLTYPNVTPQLFRKAEEYLKAKGAII